MGRHLYLFMVAPLGPMLMKEEQRGKVIGFRLPKSSQLVEKTPSVVSKRRRLSQR